MSIAAHIYSTLVNVPLSFFFFFSLIPPPPSSTLFPYTTLFRSLRSLYFSAFQSHLWNLMLSHLIERNTRADQRTTVDRKSTRLNSSHRCISYAVFCLKKKK